jgi:hypothetical protein
MNASGARKDDEGQLGRRELATRGEHTEAFDIGGEIDKRARTGDAKALVLRLLRLLRLLCLLRRGAKRGERSLDGPEFQPRREYVRLLLLLRGTLCNGNTRQYGARRGRGLEKQTKQDSRLCLLLLRHLLVPPPPLGQLDMLLQPHNFAHLVQPQLDLMLAHIPRRLHVVGRPLLHPAGRQPPLEHQPKVGGEGLSSARRERRSVVAVPAEETGATIERGVSDGAGREVGVDVRGGEERVRGGGGSSDCAGKQEGSREHDEVD